MPENIPIKFIYESDMLFSYAVLELNGDTGILCHQAEMIAQNPSPGFVPFHIRRENEEVKVFYNITSRLSLSQHLSRKTLSKLDFLDLLRNINKGLMNYVSYYLDISGFILDEDFIFINPSTGDISLVYVPLTLERDFVKDYKAFVTDIIINTANLDDSTNDNFLQRILSCLKAEEFNLSDFNRLVTDLKIGGSGTERRESQDYMGNESRTIEKGRPELACTLNHYPGTKQPMKHDKSLLTMILVQVLLVSASAAVCLILISKGSADISVITGICIIAAALDALFISKMVSGNRADIIKEENKTGGKIKCPGKKQKGAKPLKGKAELKPEAEAKRNENRQPQSDYPATFDTVVIGPHTRTLPCLDGVGLRDAQRIVIDKDKFIIGRLKSYVDYIIDSNLVGKVHAEITRKGDSYFIRDLNSKNGTYINGGKLSSNEDHEIGENDRIRFANIEYVFRV